MRKIFTILFLLFSSFMTAQCLDEAELVKKVKPIIKRYMYVPTEEFEQLNKFSIEQVSIMYNISVTYIHNAVITFMIQTPKTKNENPVRYLGFIIFDSDVRDGSDDCYVVDHHLIKMDNAYFTPL